MWGMVVIAPDKLGEKQKITILYTIQGGYFVVELL